MDMRAGPVAEQGRGAEGGSGAWIEKGSLPGSTDLALDREGGRNKIAGRPHGRQGAPVQGRKGVRRGRGEVEGSAAPPGGSKVVLWGMELAWAVRGAGLAVAARRRALEEGELGGVAPGQCCYGCPAWRRGRSASGTLGGGGRAARWEVVGSAVVHGAAQAVGGGWGRTGRGR